MEDRFNLQRFIDAQEPVYGRVCRELSAGRKASHWMWFIFPQIEGLGSSPTARFYAISGREEAVAYAEHPVLGPRLRECTALVNKIEGRSAREVFGSPDDLKFRSSMTLFKACVPDPALFEAALQKYYGGEDDRLTFARL